MMPKHSKIEFDALGTHWFVESHDAAKKQQDITKRLDRIDKTWSRFRDDSLVAVMAKQHGIYELVKDDMVMMKWYEQLYIATNGLVTPLVGQTLVDAGYDKNYTLRPQDFIHKAPELTATLSLKGTRLTVKKSTLIDVGAAGKGFAVDQIAKLLDGDYCIDAGGDIAVRGEQLRIGLEDPTDSTKIIGVATIHNESICGSATTRRSWGKWHHIINPKTAKPVTDIIATWVIAKDALHADGLATALFFVSPEKLQSLLSFEYCIVHANGQIDISSNDKIELFIKESEE